MTTDVAASWQYFLTPFLLPFAVYHYWLLLLLLGLRLLTQRLPLPGGILALPSNEANNIELT